MSQFVTSGPLLPYLYNYIARTKEEMRREKESWVRDSGRETD